MPQYSRLSWFLIHSHALLLRCVFHFTTCRDHRWLPSHVNYVSSAPISEKSDGTTSSTWQCRRRSFLSSPICRSAILPPSESHLLPMYPSLTTNIDIFIDAINVAADPGQVEFADQFAWSRFRAISFRTLLSGLWNVWWEYNFPSVVSRFVLLTSVRWVESLHWLPTRCWLHEWVLFICVQVGCIYANQLYPYHHMMHSTRIGKASIFASGASAKQ